MAKKKKKKKKKTPAPSAECCSPHSLTRFKVEAMVSVDDRGQMVLPKEVRSKAGIEPGDKMALITWEQDGEVCCLSLVQGSKLLGMVQDFLGPMMEEMVANKGQK